MCDGVQDEPHYRDAKGKGPTALAHYTNYPN